MQTPTAVVCCKEEIEISHKTIKDGDVYRVFECKLCKRKHRYFDRTASEDKTAPSPTPWTIAGEDSTGLTPIMTKYGPLGWLKNVGYADRKFIETACNAHEDLVNTLNLTLNYIKENPKLYQAAIEALTKAGVKL